MELEAPSLLPPALLAWAVKIYPVSWKYWTRTSSPSSILCVAEKQKLRDLPTEVSFPQPPQTSPNAVPSVPRASRSYPLKS